MKARAARYVSHIVRGNNEGIVRGTHLQKLKPNQVVIVMDWKMKWLVSFFREAQVQFFGKAGIAWHGVMFMITDPENANRVLVEYEDDMTDDKKEDGFAVLSSLEVALRSFRVRHPNIDEGVLFTDGAKCYAGKFLAVALPELSMWEGVNMRILHHYTGEPGKGKTELDAHFATGSRRVQESIATGQCDTVNAATLATAHKMGGGLQGSFGGEIATNRYQMAKVKNSALSGITTYSWREYVWESNGIFKELRLHYQSFFGAGEVVTATRMRNMWVDGKKQGPTGAVAINHEVVVTGEYPTCPYAPRLRIYFCRHNLLWKMLCLCLEIDAQIGYQPHPHKTTTPAQD